MSINFTTSTPYKSGGITKIIRSALATPKNLKIWASNRDEFSKNGMCLVKSADHTGNNIYHIKQICNENGTPIKKEIHPVYLSDKSKLLPYQPIIVSKLMASLIVNGFSIDASDPGTGKTHTHIKACKLLGYTPIIICPLNVMNHWKKIAYYHGVSPRLIINYDSLIARTFKKNGILRISQPHTKYLKAGYDKDLKKIFYVWALPAKTVLIFDEAHYTTGEKSERHNVLESARNYKVMLLSATFLDKFSQFKILGLRLGLFTKNNFESYMQNRGFKKDDYERWNALTETEQIVKISKLIFDVNGYGVRVAQSEIPNFPKAQNFAKCVVCKKSEIYNPYRMKLVNEINSTIFKLKKSKKNSKVNNGYRLAIQTRQRQIAELDKVSVLIAECRKHIVNKKSVIIFVNFTNTIRMLSRALNTNCILDGTISETLYIRQRNINNFVNDRERIILVNIAMCDGIELKDIKGNFPRVTLIPPLWKPKLIVQATGRPHRIGAKSITTNILFFAKNTIEEKIYNKIQKIGLKNIKAFNDSILDSEDFFKLVA